MFARIFKVKKSPANNFKLSINSKKEKHELFYSPDCDC